MTRWKSPDVFLQNCKPCVSSAVGGSRYVLVTAFAFDPAFDMSILNRHSGVTEPSSWVPYL
jgi:hypothetical protein